MVAFPEELVQQPLERDEPSLPGTYFFDLYRFQFCLDLEMIRAVRVKDSKRFFGEQPPVRYGIGSEGLVIGDYYPDDCIWFAYSP